MKYYYTNKGLYNHSYNDCADLYKDRLFSNLRLKPIIMKI